MKKLVVLMVLAIGVTLFSSCGCLMNGLDAYSQRPSHRQYGPITYRYGEYHGTEVTDYSIATGTGNHYGYYPSY